MKISEITAKVEAEHQCVLMRVRKGNPGNMKLGIPHEYDVKDYGLEHRGNKRGWFFMDATTAHAMNVVFKALNEKNKARWDSIPLVRLIKFTWENVK